MPFAEATSAELASWQQPEADVRFVTSEVPASPLDGDDSVAPLLDNHSGEEELLLGNELCEGYPNGEGRRGVQPYGGGHPGDWPWGCGGSPFRTGPGMCDTYRVGPIWNVTADGLTMFREDANLDAISAQPFMPGIYDPPPPPYLTEQFDYAPGGRITFVGKYPPWVGWQGYAVYEGIEAWEAAVIYPKLSPIPTQGVPYPPNSFEQRSIHYRSNMHSGELNVLRCKSSMWRPYCGVRYIKVDDEIRDQIDREVPPPLPSVNPVTIAFTDQLNLFDLENNLIGFQVGVRHDLWRINSRFSLEGYVNGGVYYNKIKYTNVMGSLTTQITSATATTAQSTSVSGAFNNDMTDLSEIAYVYEASLSGVCRLNKCWAMRAGYQVLWINGLHLAEDAYLDTDIETRSLLFRGWHAGIECRR
jgi:hypothetical protein